MDDLTPLEPDYQELLPEQPQSHSYGTGRQPVKARRKWPVILLVAVLLGANVLTLLALARWGEQAGFVLKPLSESSDTGLRLTTPEETQSAQETGVSISTPGGEILGLTELYRKVSPSVVTVITQSGDGAGVGTGVIMSGDGYILTNAHAVKNSSDVTVGLHDGTDCAAMVVAEDRAVDLALLKIEAQGLTAAEFGDSDTVQTGARVIAITNLFDPALSGTMTEGIISAVNPQVQVSDRTLRIFQTDAAPAAEQTGGPLFNEYGQVIGLRIHRLGDLESYRTVEEIGFALPTQELKTLVGELLAQGRDGKKIDLGIEVEDVPVMQKLYWHLPEGAMIHTIDTASAAYGAGLRAGDLIIRIDNEAVTGAESYHRILENYRGGETLRIYIYRSGRQYYADLPLE